MQEDVQQFYMKAALQQAQLAFDRDEVPIGAVVVYEDRIVGRGFNRREMQQDPTAHAEILAIQDAARRVGGWRLSEMSLYVTLEPCAMCAGAILQARLARVYFGAHEPKFGACGSVIDVFAASGWNHHVQVQGGMMAQESAALLKEFFSKRRRQ